MAQLLSSNITGNLAVALDGVAGNFSATNMVGRFTGNANSYIQVDLQNIGTGANSSGDFAITGDIGNDTQYFVDLGWSNSGYNDPAYSIMTANSGYLYTANGNLAIGTQNTQTDLVLFAGGTLSGNESMRIYGANGGARVSKNFIVIGNTTLSNTVTMRYVDAANVASPPANTLSIFVENLGGRFVLAQKGPSGLDTSLQPHLAKNKIAYWVPPGNATTPPVAFGIAAPVSSRTALLRNVATTNVFTRSRRLSYDANASISGVPANYRSAAAQFTMGTGTGLGGFFYVHRFGFSNGTSAGSNTFIGLSANIAAPAAVAANTISCVGLGTIPTSNYFHIMYGGTAAQPAVNLGASFFYNTSNTDLWEFSMYSPNSGLANTANTTLYYRLEKIGTPNIVVSSVEAGAAILPSNTTLLGIANYRDPGSQGLSCAIDLVSLYIETDD